MPSNLSDIEIIYPVRHVPILHSYPAFTTVRVEASTLCLQSSLKETLIRRRLRMLLRTATGKHQRRLVKARFCCSLKTDARLGLAFTITLLDALNTMSSPSAGSMGIHHSSAGPLAGGCDRMETFACDLTLIMSRQQVFHAAVGDANSSISSVGPQFLRPGKNDVAMHSLDLNERCMLQVLHGLESLFQLQGSFWGQSTQRLLVSQGHHQTRTAAETVA